MTERRGDEGYAVTTRRLGEDGSGSQNRRRSLISILIVVVAVSIVGISLISERLAQRPALDLSFLPTPTPRPSPSIASSRPGSSPRPTELPLITRGDEVRAGRIPFVSDAFHILDMASGEVTNGPPVLFGRDVVFDDPAGDGWLCVCGDQQLADGSFATTVRLIRIEPNGSDWSTIVDGVHLPTLANAMQQSFDVDLTPDRRHGLIAVTIGFGADRPAAVAPLDAAGRTIGDFVALPEPAQPPGPSAAPGTSAEPSPSFDPNNVSFDGPHLRIAPDGRTAVAWDLFQVYGNEGEISSAFRAWRLELAPDGSIGAIGPAPGLDEMPRWCPYVAWLDEDRLIWLCQRFSNDGSEPPVLVVTVLDAAGRTIRSAEFPASANGYGLEPIIDRANGTIYVWDQYGLTLTRIDAATLIAESVTFDPAAEVSTGLSPVPMTRPPDWANTDSALFLHGFRSLAPSADGTKLLLIAMRENTGQEGVGPINLGVFVVDRSTLALVDRWAPVAAYFGIVVLADGRSVALPGAGGMDATGHEAPWQSSVTVHDVSDGRIIARYGRLGENLPAMVVPP